MVAVIALTFYHRGGDLYQISHTENHPSRLKSMLQENVACWTRKPALKPHCLGENSDFITMNCMGLWPSYLILLYFSFHICKVGMKPLSNTWASYKD